MKRLEISFGQPVIEQIPESIEVYALEGASRVRLNEDHSGEWLESLAADALVRHRSPVTTIKLSGPLRGEFQVEFRKSEKPPIERISLCGEWTR